MLWDRFSDQASSVAWKAVESVRRDRLFQAAALPPQAGLVREAWTASREGADFQLESYVRNMLSELEFQRTETGRGCWIAGGTERMTLADLIAENRSMDSCHGLAAA